MNHSCDSRQHRQYEIKPQTGLKPSTYFYKTKFFMHKASVSIVVAVVLSLLPMASNPNIYHKPLCWQQ